MSPSCQELVTLRPPPLAYKASSLSRVGPKTIPHLAYLCDIVLDPVIPPGFGHALFIAFHIPYLVSTKAPGLRDSEMAAAEGHESSET